MRHIYLFLLRAKDWGFRVGAQNFFCRKYMYCHIRNYYLSNSKTFQDGNGNGNGNFQEINSNDFLDGNWESME